LIVTPVSVMGPTAAVPVKPHWIPFVLIVIGSTVEARLFVEPLMVMVPPELVMPLLMTTE